MVQEDVGDMKRAVCHCLFVILNSVYIHYSNNESFVLFDLIAKPYVQNAI